LWHPCVMHSLSRRGQVLLFSAGAVALALGLGALLLRPLVERSIRERIETEAARQGLTPRIGAVRVGIWPPLRLTGLFLETRTSWKLTADTVEAWWWGRTRLVVKKAVLEGPAGLTVGAESTTWDVVGITGGDFRASLVQPHSGLVLSRVSGPLGR